LQGREVRCEEDAGTGFGCGEEEKEKYEGGYDGSNYVEPAPGGEGVLVL
jgi:hypothetical protein